MRGLAAIEGQLRWVERALPEPGPGEALVRVSMAGICNTDLEIARGYMGFTGVLGHELCGVVERASDARWVGRRVAGEINIGCAHCGYCERKLERHCPQRSVLGILDKDGCFASHVTLPLVNLHVIPDVLPDEIACFIEPTAAAFEIIEQVALGPRDRVLVMGDGKLGILTAQVVATTGARTTLVGKHAAKLEVAHDLGLITAKREELEPKSFDIVIEATGSPSGMQEAVALTRPRGTIVLKSTFHGSLSLNAAPIVIDELRVIGSRCGPFEPAIAALATGEVNPRPMIAEIVAFAEAERAFARAAAPNTLKMLLDMRDA